MFKRLFVPFLILLCVTDYSAKKGTLCVCVHARACLCVCVPQAVCCNLLPVFGVSEGQLTTGNWTQRKTAHWRQVLSEEAPAVQSAALRRCLRKEGFVVVGLTFGFMTVVLPATMTTVTLPSMLF